MFKVLFARTYEMGLRFVLAPQNMREHDLKIERQCPFLMKGSWLWLLAREVLSNGPETLKKKLGFKLK